MSSTPRCLQNKKLRLLKVSDGWVTVETKGPQRYDIWRSGILLGEVRKFKNWWVTPLQWGTIKDPFTTRNEAIEALLNHEDKS